MGERGEIALKGPTLMAGYAKVPPEHVFDAEGWFRTQDEGYIDLDGRLHWKGRLSNLIKTGGANVAPLEIEAALAEVPGIKAAHAVGVPHPTLGEAVVLCVIPTESAREPVEGDTLCAMLRERLSAYKVPRAVFVLSGDEVAYTGSQKVQVEALRAKALGRLAAEGIEIAGYRYSTADLPA